MSGAERPAHDVDLRRRAERLKEQLAQLVRARGVSRIFVAPRARR
jgi:hypothetical protein